MSFVPSARRRAKITLIVANQSTQTLSFGAIALFLPLIRADLQLSFSQAGALAAAAALAYAAMQVPAGLLADSFGARRLFITGVLGANVLAAAFALLDDYGWLVVNQAASGVFRALMFAPGMILMNAQFSDDRRATAMGLYVAGGFSSNILLSALGPLLVDPLGWRWLLILFAVAGIALIAGYAYVSRGETRQDDSAPLSLREVPRIFRRGVIWWAAVAQFVRLAVMGGLNFWLPSYLVGEKALSLKTAGLILALGAALTAPANFLGGYLSDRLNRPDAVIVVSMIWLAITTAMLTFAAGLAAIIMVIAVNSIFVQLYFAPLFVIPIRAIGDRFAGVVSGFSNLCANLGGVVSIYLLGVLKEATGSFSTGLYSLAALCVVGAWAALMLGRAMNRSAVLANPNA